VKNYLRTFMNRESATQITMVAIIGLINTAVDFAVFNLLRVIAVPLYPAVAIALVIATGVSYLLNRRYTFRLDDGHVSMREAGQFLLVNLAALLVTLGIVWIAEQAFGSLSRLGENVAKIAAIVIILLPKFAAYRDVVFRRALDHRAAESRAAGEPAPTESATTAETPPGQ
jgi:putative flippase GtrA